MSWKYIYRLYLCQITDTRLIFPDHLDSINDRSYVWHYFIWSTHILCVYIYININLLAVQLIHLLIPRRSIGLSQFGVLYWFFLHPYYSRIYIHGRYCEIPFSISCYILWESFLILYWILWESIFDFHTGYCVNP